MFLPFFMALMVLGGAFLLASRFLRAYEQRNSGGDEISAMRDRIGRLEDALETTTNEVRRLSEAQHFTTRLLEGRAGPEPPRPPGSGA
jgi:hypothetical protein